MRKEKRKKLTPWVASQEKYYIYIGCVSYKVTVAPLIMVTYKFSIKSKKDKIPIQMPILYPFGCLIQFLGVDDELEKQKTEIMPKQYISLIEALNQLAKSSL